MQLSRPEFDDIDVFPANCVQESERTHINMLINVKNTATAKKHTI
jgi:hypothetical protein